MEAIKPGNFFTLRAEDHPAYDLYRALAAQGWAYDISSSRHWVKMDKGDRYISFSLFGQGAFGGRNEHGDFGVGLEDYDNVWSDALPHIATFMRKLSDDHAEMMKRHDAAMAKRAGAVTE